FSWFYMAINIGAAVTTFSLPFIRDHYGYRVAFMAPTILMAASLGVFFMGKKHYPTEEIKRGQKIEKTPQQKHEERSALVRLSGLFILIVFFWSIFDQSYSTWTLFARDHMILDLDIFSWHWKVPPDAIQSLNPILIIFFTPLFAWIWSRTDRDETHRLASPRKMLIGFLLVVLTMAVMSVGGYIAVDGKISILWELLAYALITMAELCISVVGLQLAFEEAPEHMKSMITGIWLFTVFLGDTLAAWFSRIYTSTTPGTYFGGMTVLMIVVTILFFFIGRRFEKQGNDAATA
ncbi:MAG TPA: MFS transporter, partial [Candidatus Acidoferrum sp.]|nr:MFS transporter [Candidatus Acidoferrum sp.]